MIESFLGCDEAVGSPTNRSPVLHNIQGTCSDIMLILVSLINHVHTVSQKESPEKQGVATPWKKQVKTQGLVILGKKSAACSRKVGQVTPSARNRAPVASRIVHLATCQGV